MEGRLEYRASEDGDGVELAAPETAVNVSRLRVYRRPNSSDATSVDTALDNTPSDDQPFYDIMTTRATAQILERPGGRLVQRD